jgi:hypothetical protein
MLSTSFLFEQPQQELPPEEQGSLADRIYTRAMMRVQDPDATEEEQIEDEVAQKLDQEKYAAKVAARVAEEKNRDPELKQLKAAETALSQQAAEDTKALAAGQVKPRIVRDKQEKEVEAAVAADAQAAADQAVAPNLPEKEEQKIAAQSTTQESRNMDDYI